MAQAEIGIIGGSGLYAMPGLADLEEVRISTPFGDPSDAITIGSLGSSQVAFLPRHGLGHRLSPSAVNARANIYALKSLGVERVISVSAVGSMRKEIAPLDLVIPDQLFDRTISRPRTFFGEGMVVHVGFADPFCPDLSDVLHQAALAAQINVHRGGTYLCIEGPQFSTKAESRIYRQWGVDIIGMTAIPEAKLAREAELCYATLAFATDYDVWHETAEPVTVEMIIENLQHNVVTAQRIISEAVARIPSARTCPCQHALRDAIVTQRERIPPEVRERLGPLLSKYL